MNAKNQRKLHKSKGNILWQLTTDYSPYFDSLHFHSHSRNRRWFARSLNDRRETSIETSFDILQSSAVSPISIPLRAASLIRIELNRWKINENVIKSFRSFITCAGSKHQRRLPYFISSLPFFSSRHESSTRRFLSRARFSTKTEKSTRLDREKKTIVSPLWRMLRAARRR